VLMARTSDARRRRVVVPTRCLLTVLASVGCLIQPLGRVDSCQVCRTGRMTANGWGQLSRSYHPTASMRPDDGRAVRPKARKTTVEEV
jgi:hypothetical protein